MKIEKKKMKQVKINPEIKGLVGVPSREAISRAKHRTVGILPSEDVAWVIMALQRAMSSIKNKADVKNKTGGAYHTQYTEWQRIFNKLKGIDDRL